MRPDLIAAPTVWTPEEQATLLSAVMALEGSTLDPDQVAALKRAVREYGDLREKNRISRKKLASQ